MISAPRTSKKALLLALVLGLGCAAAPAAGQYASLILGPADPICIDQPRVTVDVIDPATGESLGPEYANLFLLDTGAQGVMVAGYAVQELENNYFQIDGTFYELGIGGLSAYDLSAPYQLDFSGSDFERITLGADVRIMSNGELSFGSFGGVVGTPAMVNRVTRMDLTHMLGSESDPWSLGIDYIGVFFSQDDPPAAAGRRFTAPVTVYDFPPPEQPEPGPLPTYGPLPFVQAGARCGEHEASGDFVLDTGAQVTMISTRMALDLGIDANGNGSINDEAVGFTEFQGAGGTVTVPLVLVEKFVLPTDQGVDLVWTDLELPVYDIDPEIAGILGCELLTTGWFRAVFDTRDTGAFADLYLDMRQSDQGVATLVMDIAEAYDQLIDLPHPPGDADRDGHVNINDFIILKRNYNASPRAWGQGDFNGDGQVNIDDFILLKQNYGQ